MSSRNPNPRWAQMAQQREELERRKLQYLVKRANEEREKEKARAQAQAQMQARAQPKPLNAFSNDGSFLDRFKKLAEADERPDDRVGRSSDAIVVERNGRGERDDEHRRYRDGRRDDRDDARPERRRSSSPCAARRKRSRFDAAAAAPPPSPLPPDRAGVAPPPSPLPPDRAGVAPPPPPPLALDAIPPPAPLVAVAIPPPAPMNVRAIPPPAPIRLARIPKPRELDPGDIPRPPPPPADDDVFSAGASRLSATTEATSRNGPAPKSQSADSMRFLATPEYEHYEASVSKYRPMNNDDEVPPEEKYDPESSLRDDDSGSEDDSKPQLAKPVKLSFEKAKSESKDVDASASEKIKKELDCESDDDDEEAKQKKKERAKRRKSRWGEAPDPVAPLSALVDVKNLGLNLGSVQSPKPPVLSKVTRHDPGLLQYAIKTYGNTNLSDEDWKKCEDHYKISILYQELLQKRNEIEKLKEAGKFKYEYDSDEEIDEIGTWEHKLRQQEMEATQRWASELTRQATGKHHIGDFLPPDELKKFMDKYSSVKSGKEPDLSDYKEFKLKEDNIGFKMLQKLGWSEGEGLGVDRSGIVEPVNKGSQNDSNHGLGVERVDNLAEGDDEFDAYRKRMMLAYRFRPNPLNNPRRPYY